MRPRVLVFALSLSIAFFAALVVTGRLPTAGEGRAATSDQNAAGRPAAVAIAGGMPDLTVVAERAIASVTNISSTQIVRTPNSPFANDPFFRFFFNDPQDDAFGYRERPCPDIPELHPHEPAQVAGSHVLQLEHAEQILSDLDQHALLHSCCL